MNAKELLSQYESGERNFYGANLSRAYLSGANLSRAYLSGANLSRADLNGAYLSRAYLSGADLNGANLSGAYLSGANLSGADLNGANLSGAYLSGANLSRAYLSGANLSRAYLSGANLSRADLNGANLSGANLSGAYLSGADLSRAYLSGANLSFTCFDPDILDRQRFLTEQALKNRGFVLCWRSSKSQYVGHTEYSVGIHETSVLSWSHETDCHPGIYACLTKEAAFEYSSDVVPCLVYLGDAVVNRKGLRAAKIEVLEQDSEGNPVLPEWWTDC